MGGIEPVKFFYWLDIGRLQLNLLAGIDPWPDPVLLAGTVDAPEPACLWFVDVSDAGVVVVFVEVAVAVEAVLAAGSVFDADVDNAAAVGAVVVVVVLAVAGGVVDVVVDVVAVAVVVAAVVAGVVVAVAAGVDVVVDAVVFVGSVEGVVAVVSVGEA